jgi:DNA-binding transcriptional LysR family regulator
MDRFESMTVFAAVVEAGSLSAAGRKLDMPLATVSRKVSELEAHLNARLLSRSTRQLKLTDAGRDYLLACKRILDDVDQSERAASGEYSTPKGHLTITAPIAFGRLHVLPVVTEFLKTYPDIDVRLVLGDRIAGLLEDHIDLALRIGELPDSSLNATRVGSVRRVVCASPAYLKAHGTPKSPHELATHQCITFDALTSPKAWRFMIGKSEQLMPIRSRLSVNTAEAAVDAAVSGVGITRVLSYQMEEAKRAGLLKVALADFEPTPSAVNLVFPGQKKQPPLKLRAFLDFAAPRLRKRLQSG